MEIIVEVIVQFVLEFVFQILGEVFAEVGLRSLSEPIRRRSNPYWSAIGYALWGLIFGGLSLWLAPKGMIAWPPGRLANLLVTPLLMGGLMAAYYRWRARRTLGPRYPEQRFLNAYLLALGVAGVRYLWAH